MKLLLKTSLLWLGREYHHGDIIEMPDSVAARFVSTDQAEPIVEASTEKVEAMAIDQHKHANTMRHHQPQLRRR